MSTGSQTLSTVPTSTAANTTNTDTPSEAPFTPFEECLSTMERTELPTLAELHDGYAPVIEPRTQPPRPSNKFVLFRSWVAKTIGPKGTKVSDKVWQHLKSYSPQHRIVAHMDWLACQMKIDHETTYPHYTYQPRKRVQRKSQTQGSVKNARGLAARTSLASMVQEAGLPVASGSGQNVSPEVAAWGPEPEPATAQEGPFGPYTIPDGGSYPQGYVDLSQGWPSITTPSWPASYWSPPLFAIGASPTPPLSMASSPSEGYPSLLTPLPPLTWEVNAEELARDIDEGIDIAGHFLTWPQFHAWKDLQPMDPMEFEIDMEKFGF